MKTDTLTPVAVAVETPVAVSVGKTIQLGPVMFTEAQLANLMPVKINGRGVVLSDARLSDVILRVGDSAAKFTLSIYVQRSALTEAEADEIALQAKRAKDTKADRDKALVEERERSMKRASELGAEVTMNALRNIGGLAAAAAAIAHSR